MKSKKLTVWEAACIITGYGIGGGVLTMPYLAERNGVVMSLVIIAVAFVASFAMHLLLADLSLRSGGQQLIGIFSQYLFTGKMKKLLTIIFLALVVFVNVTTMATYITGGGEILSTYLPISEILGRVIFYVAAASVVLFGLKAVGVSEKIAVGLIFVVLAVFLVASMAKIRNPLPVKLGTPNEMLAFYGMAMFAFTSFFSVPQAVEGLDCDPKKIKKALVLGFVNILVMVLIVLFCALLASKEVTTLAMIGWSDGIGSWAVIIGSAFTILAMITTYWSVSLAISDIIVQQFKLNSRIGWLLATLPTLAVTFIGSGGFLAFARLTAGAVAILIALLIYPTYIGARKQSASILLGRFDSKPVQLLIVVAYLLMAVGNLISV